MKVESKVEEVWYGEASGTNRWAFRVDADIVIPLDAKVIVTWDDNVHECEENTLDQAAVEKIDGDWYAFQRTHKNPVVFGPIPLCPFCGKKLED